MTGNCFADADTTPLDLGDGLTVEVKNELTYGEALRLASRSRGRDPNDGFSTERYMLARLELRLVEWNLTGPDGEPAPLTPETIAGLKPAVAGKLNDALDAFDREREAAAAGDGANGAAGNAGASSATAASTSSPTSSPRASSGKPN